MKISRDSLDEFLRSRHDAGSPPLVLGFGEPMHGEGAFCWLRNELFAHLVEHWGYRSIALESSCPRGTWVDAFVRDGGRDLGRAMTHSFSHGFGQLAANRELDQAMEGGFSHGFGEMAANRELVRWMTETNRELPPNDRLAFFGFDVPTEMASTDSPTETLGFLHRFLRDHLGQAALPYDWDTIAKLIGEEARWTDSAAVMDPARSPGNTTAARELRLITDDLLTLLATEAPRLVAESSYRDLRTADLHGRNAATLLRYHAVLADTSCSPETRLSRGLAVRDAQMADNLRIMTEMESERGPMLVFAHNFHLLADEARWLLGEWDLRWWSAGALLRERLGRRYVMLATALGAAPEHGIGEPEAGTLEGRLGAVIDDTELLPVEKLGIRLGLAGEPGIADEPGPADEAAASGEPVNRLGWVDSLDERAGVMEVSYFPLEARHLRGLDALLFVRRATAISRPR